MEQNRFDPAAAYLPRRLRQAAGELGEKAKRAAEEIRLRSGREATILANGKEYPFACGGVTVEELESFCTAAAEHSRYAAQTLRQGYLTLRGGYRVGFCGTVVIKNGEVTALKDISSAVIRICRQWRGIAEKTVAQLMDTGSFRSTLILSSPGCGKTTFLRDAVRILGKEHRVSLIDERGEIAAMHEGLAQMDIGEKTDVLEGCPKAEGIFMALRVMNPQIIAVDEITTAADIRAMISAANCGADLLATVHARDRQDLMRKALYREMMEAKVFSQCVTIYQREGERYYQREELP